MNGLGDLVAVVLHRLGVTQKPDCGCSNRQARLNQLVPFSQGVKNEKHTTGNTPAPKA